MVRRIRNSPGDCFPAERAALPVRGDRPCHPLGLHPGLQGQDRGQYAAVASRDLERGCPIRIRTILTDSGKEFTDRLFGLRKRAATGEHEFDTLCAALEIEHRLTPPKSPQSEPLSAIGPRTMASGMVERFNGRIEEVLQSHHFRSGEELETTLHATSGSTTSNSRNQPWPAGRPCRR